MKSSKLKELEEKYQVQRSIEKTRIRLEKRKSLRILKWAWYYISYPFKWIWLNIRDPTTLLIVVLIVLAVSCEVWIPALLALILDQDYLWGVAAACWGFWLLPGTPFLPLCILLTMAIKSLYNKIRHKRWNNGKRRTEHTNDTNGQ